MCALSGNWFLIFIPFSPSLVPTCTLFITNTPCTAVETWIQLWSLGVRKRLTRLLQPCRLKPWTIIPRQSGILVCGDPPHRVPPPHPRSGCPIFPLPQALAWTCRSASLSNQSLKSSPLHHHGRIGYVFYRTVYIVHSTTGPCLQKPNTICVLCTLFYIMPSYFTIVPYILQLWRVYMTLG